MTLRKLLPLLGASFSVALLVVAAGRYPGGYEWLEQSVSSLFQPTTLAGEPNEARPLASLGVLAFCASMGVVFAAIARQGPTRFHRKTVQVAGIGSMVYAALVVTPMHDVLVGVALVFFVTAVLTVAHGLYRDRRRALLALWVRQRHARAGQRCDVLRRSAVRVPARGPEGLAGPVGHVAVRAPLLVLGARRGAELLAPAPRLAPGPGVDATRSRCEHPRMLATPACWPNPLRGETR